MKTLKIWASLLFLLAITTMVMPQHANAQSRRELKKMCRQQFKVCKKSNSRKFCRKQKKQCRIDNGVSFKQNLEYFKGKLFNLTQKVVGAVEFTLDSDDFRGEFIEVTIHTKMKLNMGDLAYFPNNFDSYIAFLNNGEMKDFVLRVYTSDLEERGIGEELQTSVGRSYPKFIDGIKYETIYGEEIQGKNNSFQLYFDAEKKLFGFFIPSPFVGDGITKLNELKAKIPYIGSAIPNINSIPLNIKIQKEKVGRFSLLSADAEGKNSGLILLFDHAKLKEVLRNR
jgi:hypothetical protein